MKLSRFVSQLKSKMKTKRFWESESSKKLTFRPFVRETVMLDALFFIMGKRLKLSFVACFTAKLLRTLSTLVFGSAGIENHPVSHNVRNFFFATENKVLEIIKNVSIYFYIPRYSKLYLNIYFCLFYAEWKSTHSFLFHEVMLKNGIQVWIFDAVIYA